jgi:hypothetical protein
VLPGITLSLFEEKMSILSPNILKFLKTDKAIFKVDTRRAGAVAKYLRKFGDQESQNLGHTPYSVHHYNRVARERRKGWDVMESEAMEIIDHPYLLPAEVPSSVT